MRYLIICLLLLIWSLAWAADITGTVNIKGIKKGAGVVVGCVGYSDSHQRVCTLEELILYLKETQTITSKSDHPRSTTITWKQGSSINYRHSNLTARKYLVYVRYGKLYCDWQVVKIASATDSQRVNLAVDTSSTGSLTLKFKRGAGNYNICLVPSGPGGKELLPKGDIPSDLLSYYQPQSAGGTVLLHGVKPGYYKVTLVLQQCKNNIYTGVNAGEIYVKVVAGKTALYMI